MKVHIEAVIKEDGSFMGIVTLEDIIENYLGANLMRFDSRILII